MDAVNGEIGMMPVDYRKIEADLYPLGPQCLNVFAHKVSSKLGLGDLEVGGLGVPHAETLMVLRCENNVFHSSPLGRTRPLTGVEQIRVEPWHEHLFIELRFILTAALYPFSKIG